MFACTCLHYPVPGYVPKTPTEVNYLHKRIAKLAHLQAQVAVLVRIAALRAIHMPTIRTEYLTCFS